MTRSIIITGGNAGFGFETAKLLAADADNEIVVACRNPELGHKAVCDLCARAGRSTFLQLDLPSQVSIRAFVDAFHYAGLPPLYALICNAGTQNVTSAAHGQRGTRPHLPSIISVIICSPACCSTKYSFGIQRTGGTMSFAGRWMR